MQSIGSQGIISQVSFSEDFMYKLKNDASSGVSHDELQQLAIFQGIAEIECILNNHGRPLIEALATPDYCQWKDENDEKNKTDHSMRLVNQERDYDCELLAKDSADLLGRLSKEQHAIYNAVVAMVTTSKMERHTKAKMIFVDAPGGTGKTFTMAPIIAALRAKNHVVLVTATTGIAAHCLPTGRTALEIEDSYPH